MRTTARQALRGTGLVAVLTTAVVLTGCTGSPITGTPSAAGSSSAASSSAEPGTAPSTSGGAGSTPRDRSNACGVTLSGRGNIQVNGGGTRAVTRNGVTSLACGDGQLMQVDIADGAVTFTPQDAAAVRVGAGETAEVGEYEITVESADGDRAEFEVVPPA